MSCYRGPIGNNYLIMVLCNTETPPFVISVRPLVSAGTDFIRLCLDLCISQLATSDVLSPGTCLYATSDLCPHEVLNVPV